MNDVWQQIDLFWTWLTASSQWHGGDGIPHRLLQHVYYSGVSLLCAAVIGLAVGLLIGHTGRGGFLAITLANFARAIPTFGLILFVVVIEYSITPVLVALVALAVPPILVNTFEGVRGVDADAKDAARGMGMTGWGVLGRVELPMALPLILLGLRTSAIQVVATATIAAYPGSAASAATSSTAWPATTTSSSSAARSWWCCSRSSSSWPSRRCAASSSRRACSVPPFLLI